MNRQQKENAISNCKQLFSESQAAFLVNYKGLSVARMQELRRTLRETNGSLKVTKANLMRIAVDDINGIDGFKAQLNDQIGLVFAKGDVPSVAKKLSEFSKKYASLKRLSGVFESRVLGAKEIELLASLPSREVLLAQVAGTLKAPITNLARVLNQVLLSPIYAIKQIAEKK
jgi:large subunit ribosomal protein L10